MLTWIFDIFFPLFFFHEEVNVKKFKRIFKILSKNPELLVHIHTKILKFFACERREKNRNGNLFRWIFWVSQREMYENFFFELQRVTFLQEFQRQRKNVYIPWITVHWKFHLFIGRILYIFAYKKHKTVVIRFLLQNVLSICKLFQ